MEQNEPSYDYELARLTTDLAIAALNSRLVDTVTVQDFIRATYATFDKLAVVTADAAAVSAPEKPTPAVSIKKSVTPDAIYSLIDGKPYKALRRHLTTHGYTPESYRAAYGLDPSYPLVAPSYAAKRSELAKSMGLGRKREPAPAAPSGRKRAA